MLFQIQGLIKIDRKLKLRNFLRTIAQHVLLILLPLIAYPLSSFLFVPKSIFFNFEKTKTYAVWADHIAQILELLKTTVSFYRVKDLFCIHDRKNDRQKFRQNKLSSKFIQIGLYTDFDFALD